MFYINSIRQYPDALIMNAVDVSFHPSWLRDNHTDSQVVGPWSYSVLSFLISNFIDVPEYELPEPAIIKSMKSVRWSIMLW